MKKTRNSIADCREVKVVVMKKKRHEILECKRCGHRFTRIENGETHVKQIYSDCYFFEGKDGYPNYLGEKEILINHGNRYAKIISKYINNPGTILDVGCAAGFILKGFGQNGWTCHGIDPNKTMVEYGKKEFGFKLEEGIFETFDIDKKFDLITMIQVIGHFHDIDKAMKNTNHLLKSGGFVIVESWNRSSLHAKLHGKHWQEYSPPTVIHWFSDNSIIDLFEYYGFKLVNKGLPLKYINLKHAISIIAGRMPNFFLKERIMTVFEKYLGKLNVIYPPLDIKWYVFQKM